MIFGKHLQLEIVEPSTGFHQLLYVTPTEWFPEKSFLGNGVSRLVVNIEKPISNVPPLDNEASSPTRKGNLMNPWTCTNEPADQKPKESVKTLTRRYRTLRKKMDKLNHSRRELDDRRRQDNQKYEERVHAISRDGEQLEGEIRRAEYELLSAIAA